MKIHTKQELKCVNRFNSGHNFAFLRSFSLILLLCFMVIPAVSAKSTALWDVKITIHHNNAPLSRIISDIEQKSGFSIIVRLNDVDIKERYSIDETDMSVDQVLSSLFRGKEIGFELEGEAISVFRAKNPQPNPKNNRRKPPMPAQIPITITSALTMVRELPMVTPAADQRPVKPMTVLLPKTDRRPEM